MCNLSKRWIFGTSRQLSVDWSSINQSNKRLQTKLDFKQLHNMPLCVSPQYSGNLTRPSSHLTLMLKDKHHFNILLMQEVRFAVSLTKSTQLHSYTQSLLDQPTLTTSHNQRKHQTCFLSFTGECITDQGDQWPAARAEDLPHAHPRHGGSTGPAQQDGQ